MDENCSNAFDFTQKSWKDDATFVVEGKRLYACKGVLALVSPVFETMFSSSFKEQKQEEIPLPGKKYEEFHEFFQCIYPTSSKTVTRENMFYLLPLSDEYEVSTLKKQCVQILKDTVGDMSSKEILKCYAMSIKYHVDALRIQCIQEICRSNANIPLVDADERILDIDTLSQYHQDMVDELRKKDSRKETTYVKMLICLSSNLEDLTVNLPEFESAKGATLEHTFANVFDLPGMKTKYSTPVPFWNVKFQIKTFVSDKHLACFLQCLFPEGKTERISCMVTAVMCLNVSRPGIKGYKTKVSYKINHNFTQEEDDWGYKKFRKMSTLLNEDLDFTETGVGSSAKVVVHLLANKPV